MLWLQPSDKVTIIPTLSTSDDYMCEGGNACRVSTAMTRIRGQVVTIASLANYAYRIIEDCGASLWAQDMFFPLEVKGMPYKIGDTVKVRDDLDEDAEYVSVGGTELDVDDEMLEYRGKLVTIKLIDSDGDCMIEEDDGSYFWSYGMFDHTYNAYDAAEIDDIGALTSTFDALFKE